MTIKVAIINYGIGNIRSLYNSLKKIEIEAEIITDPELIYKFNKEMIFKYSLKAHYDYQIFKKYF